MEKALRDIIAKNRQKTSSLNGWYFVTPILANLLLTMNVKNYRNVINSRVRLLSNEMSSGKWKRNGEAIIFTEEGILGDGQHRLHAVIDSGESVVMYIIFDAEPTTLFDVGAPRTVLTMFRAESVSVSYTTIAIGKFFLEHGSSCESYGASYVHDFIVERYEMIKKVESIISTRATRGSVGKKAACGALVYCMLKTGEISESDMREFFGTLNSGISVNEERVNTPALVLRRQFEELPKGGGRAMQKLQLEITYKAMRDFKFGNKRKLMYKNDTNDAERLIQNVYFSETTNRAA